MKHAKYIILLWLLGLFPYLNLIKRTNNYASRKVRYAMDKCSYQRTKRNLSDHARKNDAVKKIRFILVNS